MDIPIIVDGRLILINCVLLQYGNLLPWGGGCFFPMESVGLCKTFIIFHLVLYTAGLFLKVTSVFLIFAWIISKYCLIHEGINYLFTTFNFVPLSHVLFFCLLWLSSPSCFSSTNLYFHQSLCHLKP